MTKQNPPDVEMRTVLVVDDEPELRSVLCEILKDLNLSALEAGTGREALEVLRARKVHVVLCDIMMPEMNGLECLTEAQSEGILSPFVFVTGNGDSSKMLQAIRLGALDFISKPFEPEEIADVVFRVLDISSRRLQIHQEIAIAAPEIYQNYKRKERMISLMRVNNNKKRTG